MTPSRRIIKRSAALKRVAELDQKSETCVVIHYSCESFYDKSDGKTPRVTSIAVRNLASGQTESFSIHKVAEQKKVDFSNIESSYDLLEKARVGCGDDRNRINRERRGSYLTTSYNAVIQGWPNTAVKGMRRPVVILKVGFGVGAYRSMHIFLPIPFISGQKVPYPYRNRHAQIGHDIHGRDAGMNFSHLGFKQPRGQGIDERKNGSGLGITHTA